MKIVKNIFILAVSLVGAYFLGLPFASLYSRFFPSSGGGLFIIDAGIANFIVGFILGYIFLIVFLFTVFGGIKKYWWIGIALIPAILFQFLDLRQLYFPIAIGLVAWLLGRGVALLIEKK